MDWKLFGSCVAALECAIVLACCAWVGARALRKLSATLLLALALFAAGATLTAQKTNNVPPNMNQPQMQQGGGFAQTGFTELTGLPGSLPHTPSSQNPVNLVNPVQNNISVQTTSEDIARGWRVESVTTNAAVSYAMPTNATLVGNCHVRGAASSFGNNRIDLTISHFLSARTTRHFRRSGISSTDASARLRATPRTRSARSARRCPPCRAKADCGRPKSRTALA